MFRTDDRERELQRMTQADLERARQTVQVRIGPIGTRPYLVHPADKRHLDEEPGGQPRGGCMICLAIWQRAEQIRGLG